MQARELESVRAILGFFVRCTRDFVGEDRGAWDRVSGLKAKSLFARRECRYLGGLCRILGICPSS